MSKVGFITGATRGIGKQIAITLAKQGYDIAINYREENEQLQETKKEIEALNVKCLAVKGDISHYEDCENMVKKVIEEFGKIDVLVNNAGITKDMLLLRMKEEDFRKVIDVNLIGTFNMCKNVTSYMMKERNARKGCCARRFGTFGTLSHRIKEGGCWDEDRFERSGCEAGFHTGSG